RRPLLHPCPTRRSSDLTHARTPGGAGHAGRKPAATAAVSAPFRSILAQHLEQLLEIGRQRTLERERLARDRMLQCQARRMQRLADRKSTRLNSSHVKIS